MGAIDKEYLLYKWNFGANILMIDFQGGDFLARKIFFPNYQFWLSYYLLKPSQIMHTVQKAGDENQSCHILVVIVNLIEKLRIPKYNLYISIKMYQFLQRYGGVIGQMLTWG